MRVDEMEQALAAFLRARPEYSRTCLLDEWRETEYGRLDRNGVTYLDYTGGSLYGISQIRAHGDILGAGVFGNPHSDRASSGQADRVEQARASVLDFFHAPAAEYVAIFTPNASGALKLVGESYPFSSDSRLLLTVDNHNSVNGIREFARARGARIAYAPLNRPDLRLDADRLSAHLREAGRGRHDLFAYPAQSNFTGVQHPLEWIDEAHAAGWDVLVDAAAFVPTNRLDLGRWRPDFVAISFYKMFGYPTGVGCLLVRKEMLAKLRRPWFAGGTVRIASVQADRHYLAKDAAAYEDGTVNYLSLPAVCLGLRHLSRAGIDRIHERVRCLTGHLLEGLAALRHTNGAPLVRLHGPGTTERRGGVIAFHLVDPEGRELDIDRIQAAAAEARIAIRTGCFCNPGVGEVVSGLSRSEMGAFFQDERGMEFEELRARARETLGKEVGAVRVSLGIASNFADVYRFLRFVRCFSDRRRTQGEAGGLGAPARPD